MSENKEDDEGSGGETTTPTTSTAGPNTTATASTTSNTTTNKSKGKGRDKSSNLTHFGSNEKNFEGAQPSVGGILALKTERLDKKVTFEIFKEKVKTYILSEFKNENVPSWNF